MKGWTISYDAAEARSGQTIHGLAYHLVNTLPGREWRHLAPIFTRRNGEPFTVSTADAARAADLLRKAADHHKMPADWGRLARQLADAAEKAASARQPWEWSQRSPAPSAAETSKGSP